MSFSDESCFSGARPVVLSERNVCNPGFLCANNSDSHPPEYCPPTPECFIRRLELVNNICDESQGVYEPLVCRPGQYCPPGASPFRCGRVSVCPPGSDREFVLDGFIIVFVIDLIMFCFIIKPYIGSVFLAMRKRFGHRVTKTNSLDIESQGINHEFNGFAPAHQAIGKFAASVRSCVGLSEIGFSFGFENLSQVSDDGKTIIAPQSGNIPQGCVWGVLGPSGAGKTSFVNLLMGKATSTTGRVYVNGLPSQVSRFKKLIGYVPQDDVIMPECTVRENILHSTMTLLPTSWTDAQRVRHTDILLSCLNLTDVQHRVVGDSIKSNISGGQRKRVSIGMELAAAPVALVLDEPTSGLDATASLSIINLLRKLSREGVTIICILHQPRPEILDLIDGLTILHRGYQLYHDKVSGLGNYFYTLGFDFSNKVNIADAALDLISDDSAFTAQSLAERWAAYPSRSPDSRLTHTQGELSRKRLESMIHSASCRGLPRYRQAYLCFIRSLKQQSVRISSFVLEIGVSAVAGLLIGLSLYQLRGQHFQGVYYPPFQSLSSALNYTTVPEIGLLCNTAIALASAAPGVKIFGEEKQVYWREAAAGHSRSAYYLGKTIATVPRIAIASLHFTAFYCILATPWMAFWKVYLTNFLYFYCIYGLAAIVSMIVRREDGPLLAMIFSLIIGVFGGYGPPLYNVKEWHLEWFWRLCPGIWFTEAYFDQHLGRVAHLYDLDAAATWAGYVRGRFGLDIALLLIIGSVYRIVAFGGLVGLNREKQT